MGSLAYKWLEGFLEEQKRAAIARQAGGAGAQEGLDWTPHHKLTKLGGLSPGLMEGIKSVWHAGVITESKPGWCKKCQMPATLEHVLKECPYWREQGFKEPKLQEYLRHKYPWECLWTRALLRSGRNRPTCTNISPRSGGSVLDKWCPGGSRTDYRAGLPMAAGGGHGAPCTFPTNGAHGGSD